MNTEGTHKIYGKLHRLPFLSWLNIILSHLIFNDIFALDNKLFILIN